MSVGEHHLRYTKIINKARTKEEEVQEIIIIKRFIRIIRIFHFIFRIIVSFQNQFISIIIEY